MKKIALLIIAFTFVGGCAIGPVNGLLFTNNKFAGEFNPANDVAASKSAKGCIHYIAGGLAFGDASAGGIAKRNGITKIATVDHSTMNVLQIVYSSYCTIVTGQ